jgi:hypothetical protein
MKLIRREICLSDDDVGILRSMLNVPISELRFNNHHERFVTYGNVEAFQPASLSFLLSNMHSIKFSNEFALLSGGNNFHYWHKLKIENYDDRNAWLNKISLKNIVIRRIEVYSVSLGLVIHKHDNFPKIRNYVKENLQLDMDEFELYITSDQLLVLFEDNNKKNVIVCKDAADCSIEFSNNDEEINSLLSLKVYETNQLKYNYRMSII